LRFYGYFKESVVESRLENFRIHSVLVYYFLEDKSIMIIEPKIVNSGVPQGAFLKRQMVLKGDGMSPFMPEDFRVGVDIGIHGRSIRVTDADEYTRQFFVVSTCIKLKCVTDIAKEKQKQTLLFKSSVTS
jgi:hypothetical protein